MRSSRLALSATLPLFMLGCAHRQQTAPNPAPTPAATPEAAASPDSAVPRSVRTEEHYLVKKGDCLWAIAARKRVFGDPFAWPLLYRENRDQIQDPDLIYARQSLNYSHEASSAELKEARAAAAAAPPYHPHPKELPVQ